MPNPLLECGILLKLGLLFTGPPSMAAPAKLVGRNHKPDSKERGKKKAISGTTAKLIIGPVDQFGGGLP